MPKISLSQFLKIAFLSASFVLASAIAQADTFSTSTMNATKRSQPREAHKDQRSSQEALVLADLIDQCKCKQAVPLLKKYIPAIQVDEFSFSIDPLVDRPLLGSCSLVMSSDYLQAVQSLRNGKVKQAEFHFQTAFRKALSSGSDHEKTASAVGLAKCYQLEHRYELLCKSLCEIHKSWHYHP